MGACEFEDDWTVNKAFEANFVPSVNPNDFKVAIKSQFSANMRARHINEKELNAVVSAVRWASRSARTRNCRLVLQSDSAVSVAILRKGRSSKPGLLRQTRRLAATKCCWSRPSFQ